MQSVQVNTARVIADLEELRALTGDERGAQRLAWTPVWDRAREWLRGKLAECSLSAQTDEAGNLWTELPGERAEAVVIGGHIDSVPDGGWLDGSLNVVAGLEILRCMSVERHRPVSLRLVDWADEEGARFGRSLFGSSAASGNLNIESLGGLSDRSGIRLLDELRRYGLEPSQLHASGLRLAGAKAYLELHIEQGPVLESRALPLAAVLGTVGIVRHRVVFSGQSAHAGTTPMEFRRDAYSAAARFSLEIREIARAHDGVATVGQVVCTPGISSAVAGRCEILLEQRHLDPQRLSRMVAEAKHRCAAIAADEKVDVEWSLIWEIPPVPFHPQLIELAAAAGEKLSGSSFRMASGALHDASEVARAGVPTAMIFVQSLRGLSHTKEEDTLREHIELSVEALSELTSSTIDWVLRTAV